MQFLSLSLTAFLSSIDNDNAKLPSSTFRSKDTRTYLYPVNNINTNINSIDHSIRTIDNMWSDVGSSSILHVNDKSIGSKAVESHIRQWLDQILPPAYAYELPSEDDIRLLNQAMDAYNNNNNNRNEDNDDDSKMTIDLLSKVLLVWKDQPSDEIAALYRLRADVQMRGGDPNLAKMDYTRAIDLLTSNTDDADPNELPTAYLGRARAIRSMITTSSTTSNSPSITELSLQAAMDYQMNCRLSSREEWDTNPEREEDGASRNPYAAWEWGMSLRQSENYIDATRIHVVASQAFADIGDKARSVISLLDAGIDMAAATSTTTSTSTSTTDTVDFLTKAIAQTTKVEGRNVDLLQRVIAKEGEARIALASILWSTSGKLVDGEEQFGQACQRLEQLEQDAITRGTTTTTTKIQTEFPKKTLKYSIDDQPGALDISCSRFKNDKFLEETLQWPKSLREKVQKLNRLE